MIPHLETVFDLSHGDEIVCQQIEQTVVRDLTFLFSSHENDCKNRVHVAPLSGGNTNKLYKIDITTIENEKTSEKRSILCRVNGIGTEFLLDRQQEMHYMRQLSLFEKGPNVLCTFNNGFFYDFIPGRCLQPNELLGSNVHVAKHLAHFHKVTVESQNQENESEKHREPICFATIRKWLADCMQFKWNESELEKKEKLNLDLDQMKQYVDQLEQFAQNYGLDVVFCHNDLLAYNILKNEQVDKYYFIDYEYCGYNYRAFDIGNHFCEYCGFTVDPSKYPSVEAQRQFIKAYLQAAKTEEGKEEEEQSDAVVVSDEEIEALRVQCNLFSLVAHLFWSTWGVWQSKHSNIDFDYLNYAGEKYAWFNQGREQYMQEFVKFYEK